LSNFSRPKRYLTYTLFYSSPLCDCYQVIMINCRYIANRNCRTRNDRHWMRIAECRKQHAEGRKQNLCALHFRKSISAGAGWPRARRQS
jgi:hypothetical protein